MEYDKVGRNNRVVCAAFSSLEKEAKQIDGGGEYDIPRIN